MFEPNHCKFLVAKIRQYSWCGHCEDNLAFQITIDLVRSCFYIFIDAFIEIHMDQQPFSSFKYSILISDIFYFLV